MIHFQIHDVGHPDNLFTVQLHRDILLEVVRRVSLVPVQRPFVPGLQLPNRHRDRGALLWGDGGEGALRAAFELQLIIFYRPGTA